MKRYNLVLTAAVVLTAVEITSQVLGATVTVDVKKHYQRISGFGTCSAWCGTLTASEGELLWSTTKGAGLSLHRVQIQRTGLDQSETANTKLAYSYGVKVWGTPWYCKNGVSTGKGYDTLYESNYQGWADVLAATANSMKNAGTPLYAISSGNETDLGWTKYNAPTLAKWVGQYLGPTMASKAPDTKVIGIETCNWYGFSGYEKVFKADSKAWQYSSILATHEYGGSPSAYPEINAAGKEFWETEKYDDKTDVEDPGMGSGLRISKLIHDALTIASMNAWHFWWIKPCAGCKNGALWVEATKQPSKRLWIMGNWSRFVRPGFVRVDATANPTSGAFITAFCDSVPNKVVIVAINNNTSSVSQDFSIPGITPKMMTPCITDPNRDLAGLPSQTLSSGTFTYSLPGQSVTSLVIDLVNTSILPLSKTSGSQSLNLKINCSKSSLRMDFTALASGLTCVRLFDFKGKIVKDMSFQTESGKSYSRNFALPKTPEGFYIVKIESNGKTIGRSKVLLTE